MDNASEAETIRRWNGVVSDWMISFKMDSVVWKMGTSDDELVELMEFRGDDGW